MRVINYLVFVQCFCTLLFAYPEPAPTPKIISQAMCWIKITPYKKEPEFFYSVEKKQESCREIAKQFEIVNPSPTKVSYQWLP